MDILKNIRTFFTDFLYVASHIPEIVKEYRASKAKEIIRTNLHKITDHLCDSYVNTLVECLTPETIQHLQNLVIDVSLLIAKYKDPAEQIIKQISESAKKNIEGKEGQLNKWAKEMKKALDPLKAEIQKKYKLPSKVIAEKEEAEAKAKKEAEELKKAKEEADAEIKAQKLAAKHAPAGKEPTAKFKPGDKVCFSWSSTSTWALRVKEVMSKKGYLTIKAIQPDSLGGVYLVNECPFQLTSSMLTPAKS